MHRHDVSQPDAQVLADHLVHADLVLVHSVIRQDNADGVLALLALQDARVHAMRRAALHLAPQLASAAPAEHCAGLRLT